LADASRPRSDFDLFFARKQADLGPALLKSIRENADKNNMIAALKTFICAVLCFSFVLICGVNTAAAEKNEEKPMPDYTPASDVVFKKYQPAVAKVVVRQYGVPVEVGAGFFVSKDGWFMTNHHVMRNAISKSGFSADFILSDKRVLKNYRVGDCSDQRGLDLCLIKFDFAPKSFFTISEQKPKKGDSVYVIGHPRGLDFTLTRGKFNAARKSVNGISEIELTSALSPGHSGGPVIDDDGHLLGIVTEYFQSNPNLGFAIGSSELLDYQNFVTTSLTIAQAGVRVTERAREINRKVFEDEMQPALRFATEGKEIKGVGGFKEIAMDFDGQILTMVLPNALEPCQNSKLDNGSVLYACFGLSQTVAFTVQRFPMSGESLIKKNGRMIVPAKPHLAVQSLMGAGQWDYYDKSLSASARKTFFSQPSIAECQVTGTNPEPSAFFGGNPTCRFSVKDDTEFGAYSSNTWIEKGSFLYGFSIWMNDPTLKDYFSQVPTLAILTARLSSKNKPATIRSLASTTLSNKPLPNYEIDLANKIAFIGARVVMNGDQFDMYGKKSGFGNSGEDSTFTVTSKRKSVLPPEYNEFVRSVVNEVAIELEVKIQPKTVEVEALKIGENPGRMLSVVGTNKNGEKVVVLIGSAFGEEDTHLLIQTSHIKDLTEGLRQFKEILSAFRQK
jgi:S1-C subfamily serine protease